MGTTSTNLQLLSLSTLLHPAILGFPLAKPSKLALSHPSGGDFQTTPSARIYLNNFICNRIKDVKIPLISILRYKVLVNIPQNFVAYHPSRTLFISKYPIVSFFPKTPTEMRES